MEILCKFNFCVMRFIIVIVLFLLGIYGCTTDEKMPSQGVILLKHKVNSLDNISDYIEGGYNGIEFDLHISDASLLVFYDDLGKANSFIDYINYIKKHPKDYFWIDLKEYTLKGLLEFCRKIPPLPNVFIETNVDEVVDFLTGKGYNVIYTIRHVGHWYESNILLLKDEISGVIENDPITGLASNHVMYFRMKDTYPLFPKYVWYTSSEGEVDMDIPEQILTDPSVVVLLLDFDDVHELRLYEERVNK